MSWLYDYKAQFPLGILYLSGVLKKEGWMVEVFDSNANSIAVSYTHLLREYFLLNLHYYQILLPSIPLSLTLQKDTKSLKEIVPYNHKAKTY